MSKFFRRGVIGTLGIMVMAAGMLTFPATIAAKGPSVTHTGSCSASSDWKLKVGQEGSRLQVEFEVDQNVNGQAWNVTLKHNGNGFWSGQRMTQAPSGSFSVSKLTSNAAGADTIVGRAVNARTGEVCRGTVTF